MPEYTAMLSPDGEAMEILVGLSLTKEHLVSALAYGFFSLAAGGVEEFEAKYWLLSVGEAGALEAIADNMITYGPINIQEHDGNPVIDLAARAAIERLWPGMR